LLGADQNKECSCYSNGICLDSRYASWVVATFVLLSFGFFMCGYFMGKRVVMQDLHITAEKDALADQVYTSLCTRQDKKIVMAQQEKATASSLESTEMLYNSSIEAAQNTFQEVSVDASDTVVDASASDNQPTDLALNTQQKSAQENSSGESHQKYYAQLIGFGTKKAAEKFARRLQHNNMPVTVKSRHSSTAKGKKITWYQVVTQELTDKNLLEKLVNEITLKERLVDVRIITC